jgi:transcriptional regulator with XRE-family HTH domain
VRISAEYGVSLRVHREALGLSVDEMARRAGIPSSELSAIECGGNARANYYWRFVAHLDHLRRATPPAHRPFVSTLGGIVKHERERQGLSIDDVAERTALKAGWIADVENARISGDVLSLEALARRGLGLQLSDLVEATEHLLGDWMPNP